MTEQEVGFVDWKGWGLKLVMTRGRLRQIMFGAKSRATKPLKPEMAAACEQLREYLGGSRKGFALELDIEGTEFQKQVWNALLEIPYGETRTYKQVAQQIGRPHAYRAVGQAAHKNPLPIVIPCHRLVGSDGSLTGFAGGLELKRSLLQLEHTARGQK